MCAGPALDDAEDDPIAVFNRRATEHLVGQNYHEVVNYTLRSRKELATWVSEAAAVELGRIHATQFHEFAMTQPSAASAIVAKI